MFRTALLLLSLAGALAASRPGFAADAAAPTKKELNRAAADAFFTNGTLYHFALEISEENIESLRKAPREYVPAKLRAGNEVLTNIAVHLKGGSGSFRKVDDRPGLTLDFNRYEDGGRFRGLKKLHLNNCNQDPTRLSEFIGGQLFREAGVPAARAAHAVVELNGRRLGFYVALESMDDVFLARNFKDKKGNLYGQTRGCDITDPIERMEGETPLTHEDLKALLAAVQETNLQARVQAMEQRLDMVEFISFMAMEIIVGHHDSYTLARHNYRIYHDPGAEKISFLPHDLDQLMRRPNFGIVVPTRGIVAQAVMNTPELAARFQTRAGWLVTNVFAVPRLTQHVDRAVAALLPGLQAYDAEIAAAFTNTAAEFKARLINRGLGLQRKIDIMHGLVPAFAFQKDSAPVTGWIADPPRPGIQLARARSEDRKPSLWMKWTGTNIAIASWRAQVLLEPGCYRLEGMARCDGVASGNFRRRRGEGVALVAPAFRSIEPPRLAGDFTWQKLSHTFEVTTRDDVELACELRADQGEVWIQEDSLRLVRLPPDAFTNFVAQARRGQQAATATLNRAGESVRAAAQLAARDAQRPAYHFRPPAQWMGALCGGFNQQGRHHVFFQFNPWTNTPGLGAGWGHARSRDLVRWEYLTPALLPDEGNGSILDGPGSAALDANGNPILFYAHTPAEFPKAKREQWAALPEDESLMRWRRVNIGLAAGSSGVSRFVSRDWSDMSVWQSGGRTFATFKNAGGLICEALNPALTRWKNAGDFSGPDDVRANLIRVESTDVLLRDTAPVICRTGTFDPSRVAFRADSGRGQALDPGLTGTTVFKDAKDRPVMLGLITGFPTNRAWQGVMSLPRVLRLDGGQILQEPLPELAQLRGRPAFLRGTNRIDRSARTLDLVRGDMLEVMAEIKPGTARAFGLRLRGGISTREELLIRCTPEILHVAGKDIPVRHPPGGVFKCRFFFDRSVLEAFFDDGRIAVTRVVLPSTPDLRVEMFAEDGDVTAQKFEAWTMRPAW
jgi:beta-fructofuranosidase